MDGEFAPGLFDRITDIRLDYGVGFSTNDNYTFNVDLQPKIKGAKRWAVGDSRVWSAKANGEWDYIAHCEEWGTWVSGKEYQEYKSGLPESVMLSGSLLLSASFRATV